MSLDHENARSTLIIADLKGCLHLPGEGGGGDVNKQAGMTRWTRWNGWNGWNGYLSGVFALQPMRARALARLVSER